LILEISQLNFGLKLTNGLLTSRRKTLSTDVRSLGLTSLTSMRCGPLSKLFSIFSTRELTPVMRYMPGLRQLRRSISDVHLVTKTGTSSSIEANSRSMIWDLGGSGTFAHMIVIFLRHFLWLISSHYNWIQIRLSS